MATADDLLELANAFIRDDTNADTRSAAQAMLARGDERELRAHFVGRLEFGTAGLRGPMGPGFTHMNELTVIQAAQGLVQHLVDTFGEDARARGILLGYDHRELGTLNSQRFAHLTAVAAFQRGVRVHLFSRQVCTPLVAYGCRQLGTVAGVMVTASHNPKQDNGYKVYGGLGAQIVSPVDQHIAAQIEANLTPWDPAAYACASEGSVRAHPLCAPDSTDALLEQYLAGATSALCRHAGENGDATLPHVGVCYTAMHGVGTPFTTALLARFGLPPPTLTLEQVAPDPSFPTVAFPNPEEGRGALALAMATADRACDTLILANDPDADRLAVAEWTPHWVGSGGQEGWAPRTPSQPGEWRVFTGNEIGTLLAHWMWCGWVASHGGGASGPHSPSSPRPPPLMLASTVSSKMVQSMAKAEGFAFQETLTGFKWMGTAMAEHEAAGTGDVIFAYEEAIGFAVWHAVRDKDGVTAGAVFAEMANALARRGKSCSAHLHDLSTKYGTHVTSNGYIFVDTPAKSDAIFARLRNEGHYWLRLGDLTVTGVRDLTGVGWDSEGTGGKPSLPTSTGSHMLTYKFSNSVVATLRTSGTEPKLKWYSEGRGAPGQDAASVRAETHRTVRMLVDEMLRPEAHGLKRPALPE